MAQHTIRSYFGGRIRLIAKPAPGWASTVIGVFGFTHRCVEWAARRWAPRFYPIIRLGRILSIVAVLAFAWAGAGVRCIRIGRMFYVQGRWLRVDDIVDVRGLGAPHPVYRRLATTIVLRSGYEVETDVEVATVRDLLRNWR